MEWVAADGGGFGKIGWHSHNPAPRRPARLMPEGPDLQQHVQVEESLSLGGGLLGCGSAVAVAEGQSL